jgi:hypothetical protein
VARITTIRATNNPQLTRCHITHISGIIQQQIHNNILRGVGVATTKAAETYAALTGLVEGGMRLSDAVRQLASETGRSESAIRASYYQQRSKLGESSPRSQAPVSVEDAVREARQLLGRALAGIDAELAIAKADLDTARERYETLKASATQRKAELERKIAAL